MDADPQLTQILTPIVTYTQAIAGFLWSCFDRDMIYDMDISDIQVTFYQQTVHTSTSNSSGKRVWLCLKKIMDILEIIQTGAILLYLSFLYRLTADLRFS